MPGGCQGVLALRFANRTHRVRAGSVDHVENACVGFLVDASRAGDGAYLRLVGFSADELIKEGGLPDIGRTNQGDTLVGAKHRFGVHQCQINQAVQGVFVERDALQQAVDFGPLLLRDHLPGTLKQRFRWRVEDLLNI